MVLERHQIETRTIRHHRKVNRMHGWLGHGCNECTEQQIVPVICHGNSLLLIDTMLASVLSFALHQPMSASGASNIEVVTEDVVRVVTYLQLTETFDCPRR